MADKVFKLVVGAAVGILVIRYLGPARFGQWELVAFMVAADHLHCPSRLGSESY